MTTSSDSRQNDRLATIESMWAENPDDPFLAYAAALEYMKMNKLDEALERLMELKQKHPDYLPLYYQLGKVLESKGDLQGAIGVYQEGKEVARSQNDYKTLGELSEALLVLDDE